ncbi:hypothetical protein HMPREF9381_0575 [Streptococcus sanguinis SK72]|uniref:Uncharacterized protein n=1 Tax=Streptococcus sanguinis SK72 TaxID=888809 RepID=F0I085_STRSA|nr:hypothetical protein HMPREF9381_0575 [Streptococcus sanguinis SK72]KXT82681.1 hypothetical protein STRDD11_01810 [Streptococcus sp. DD11]
MKTIQDGIAQQTDKTVSKPISNKSNPLFIFSPLSIYLENFLNKEYETKQSNPS